VTKNNDFWVLFAPEVSISTSPSSLLLQ